MNPQDIANQLIAAIEKQSQEGLVSLEQDRRNDQVGIMNRANARGSLYSTQPQTQKLRQDAAVYLPKQATLRSAPLMSKLSIQSGLIDTQRQIDALNKSAAEINGLNFDKYGVIV